MDLNRDEVNSKLAIVVVVGMAAAAAVVAMVGIVVVVVVGWRQCGGSGGDVGNGSDYRLVDLLIEFDICFNTTESIIHEHEPIT